MAGSVDLEEVAEPLVVKVRGLGGHLLRGEGGPQDGVVPGESAVAAVIHALVGEMIYDSHSYQFDTLARRMIQLYHHPEPIIDPRTLHQARISHL